MDDHQFRQLLNHLGLSWRGYRKVRKGVKKRIARHMQALHCRSMNAYLVTLDSNQDARNDCMGLVTVSISRFFRDRALWETMATHILPLIIKEHPRQVKVWSAGCARGEEAYTFKIVWLMEEELMGAFPELVFWATDVNPEYLGKAKVGVYSHSSLKEVPQAVLGTYFRSKRKGRSWQIMDAVKEGIRWQMRDLFSSPPDHGFHLIFLRNNLLTYYEDTFRVPAFERVVSSLARGGYLIIGSHEDIPPGFPVLRPSGHHPCIFQKSNSGS